MQPGPYALMTVKIAAAIARGSIREVLLAMNVTRETLTRADLAKYRLTTEEYEALAVHLHSDELSDHDPRSNPRPGDKMTTAEGDVYTVVRAENGQVYYERPERLRHFASEASCSLDLWAAHTADEATFICGPSPKPMRVHGLHNGYAATLDDLYAAMGVKPDLADQLEAVLEKQAGPGGA